MKTVSTTVEKIKNTYVCEFCGKEFGRKKDCESHENSCSERAVVLTREVNRLTEEYVGHYIVRISKYDEDDYLMRVTIPKSFEVVANVDVLYPTGRKLIIEETYDEYTVKEYSNHSFEQKIQFDQTIRLWYNFSDTSVDSYPYGRLVFKDRTQLEIFFNLFVGLYNMDQNDVRDKHVQDIGETLMYYYNKYKAGEHDE